MSVISTSTCTCTVKPLYSGHHWDCSKCPNYKGVLISEVGLYRNVVVGQCPDYRGVLISECPE